MCKSFLLAILLSLFLFTSLASVSQEAVTLQLNWRHQFEFAGYYVAKEHGFYSDAGLNVTILEAAPGSDFASKVLDGHAQYGVGISDLILLRANNKPVVALATIYQHSPYVLITNQFLEESDFKNFNALRFMMDSHAYEIMAYLKKAGADLNKLNLVPHSDDVMDLAKGKIEAYAGDVSRDLFILDAANTHYDVYYPRALNIDFYGDTLFTTEDEIALHPARVEAFLEASLKGWQFAMAHPDETIEMMIKMGYASAQHQAHLQYEARVMQHLINPEQIEIGYMSSQRWKKIADTYSELGLLPAQPQLQDFLYDANHTLQQTIKTRYLIGILIMLLLVGSTLLFTRHLNSRKKIKEMQDLIDRVFENSPHYVFVKEAKNLTYVRVNKAYCDLFGREEKDFIGKTAGYFHNVEDEKKENALDQAALLNNALVNTQQQVMTKQGARIWQSKKVPLRNSRGNVNYLLVLAEDITERSQAEEKLRANEQLWSNALESTGQGVWDWHINKNLIVFSKNWLSMLGFIEHDIESSVDGFFKLVHPEDLAQLKTSLDQYLVGYSPAFCAEIRMKEKSGTWKWILTRGVVTNWDHNNKASRLVGTHADIHAQKRAILHEKWRNQVLERIMSRASLNQILSTIEVGVEEEAAGAVCAILLLDAEGKRVVNTISASLPQSVVGFISNYDLNANSNSCTNRIFNRDIYVNNNFKESINSKNIQSQDDPFKQVLLNAGFESYWSAPIITANSDMLGALAIFHLFPRIASEDDVKMLTLSAQFTGLAIERKAAADTIINQANVDGLTNLLNRRMFQERLSFEILTAKHLAQQFAVLFIDLDRFKSINDALGHHVGDALLVNVAERITAEVRETDTVARLGGDEFTVILQNVIDKQSIIAMTKKIIDAISQPYLMAHEQLFLTASIGITLYPQDADTMSDLLKNADQAMFEAKKQGRHCYAFFSHAMNEAIQAKQLMAKDLKNALINDELSLHFQPIVDLKTGIITKAEALIRWTHPVRGMVSPMEFIAVAEEMGFIKEVGNWVFLEAIKWKKYWFETCGLHFKLAVNMSPAQFNDVNETHDWLNILANSGLSGEHFIIEITEGLLLDDDDRVTKMLKTFHAAGFEISIDDFGTGYSALSYLKKFDINFVKIDRSFVRDLSKDINDLALCEAIIVMSHKLGLKVVAEGIETASQKSLLTKAGCDYAQGYLFSKPMPPEAFEQLLNTENAFRLSANV